MDKTQQVYLFYLVLILAISLITFHRSEQVNKMDYALIAVVAGVLVSYVLWFLAGKKYSEQV